MNFKQFAACVAVFLLVLEERTKQNQQWGGEAHDDNHDRSHWWSFRKKFESRALDARPGNGGLQAQRDAVVKIAALAFAQIESLDRKLERGKK